MLEYIHLYCERTAPEFWNEPLNALSNLAFVLAALLAWRMMQKRGGADVFEKIVIVLAGLIGIGSFAFHTVPNSLTEYSDTIPIWSFVAGFIAISIYRATAENPARTLRIAGIALVITGGILWLTGRDIATGAEGAPAMLNGSLQYLPAVIALVVFAALMQWRGHPARGYVLGATVVFMVSLVFRTIDLTSCASTGTGTHFLWHLLNGAMVGLLLMALVKKMPPRAVSG